MNPVILPSKSFDKDYLLRLLNGNTVMMGVIINEIFHHVPTFLNEIDSSLKKNDSLGVSTFATRTKSALHMLREDQLANEFNKIEYSARQGEWPSAKIHFNSISNETTVVLNTIKAGV